jgi:hypothetical protein
MYPIVDVPDNASDSLEQLGTKYKFWFDNDQQLFKLGRENTGEHWSEKVCSEVAGLLGLPHARYELARWRGRLGVVSQNFAPKPTRLVLGNEVLAKQIADYPHAKRYEAREHRITTVLALLRHPDVGLPLGFDQRPLVVRACDVFVGYVLLDALVSNQDRHHENWGYVATEDAVHLAPTFDHASSLGRNETDATREDRLSTRDAGRSVEHYVQRAKSSFFPATGDDVLSTLAAFQESAKIRGPAAQYWLGILGSCPLARFEQIFADLPPEVLSNKAREFAFEMIRINRRRLLQLQ